jgi:hypothetical protein
LEYGRTAEELGLVETTTTKVGIYYKLAEVEAFAEGDEVSV